MRGLILAVVLAAGVAGCAGTRGAATSPKAARPTQEVETVDCAQERKVAAYISERFVMVLKAAKTWRARAIELKEQSEKASADCE